MVKRKTGFDYENLLLSFIVIVCNGDVNKMKKKETVLTWYEEWFLCFQIIWGRTLQRWEDLEDKLDGYGLKHEELRKAFDAKVAMIEDCRNSWPAFATYDEDKELSDDELIRKYLGIRPNIYVRCKNAKSK